MKKKVSSSENSSGYQYHLLMPLTFLFHKIHEFSLSLSENSLL